MVTFHTCLVGEHNYNGKIEKRIWYIKESLDKSSQNERLYILQWETISTETANSVNGLPLASGNIVRNYENMDLLNTEQIKFGTK